MVSVEAGLAQLDRRVLVEDAGFDLQILEAEAKLNLKKVPLVTNTIIRTT